MAVSDEPRTSDRRVDIVNTVQTPLGFFVLVVLVVEALLGVFAAIDTVNRDVIVAGMLGLILVLVGVVAFLAYRRPEALLGARPAEAPKETKAVSEVMQLRKPRFLCAATPEFMSMGFEQDSKLLQGLFGRRARVVGNLDAETLRKLLTTERFDVVHLLAFVDPSDGSLVLDRDNPQARIPARGLANLLEVCNARLIVLAVCDSIVLAAHVSRHTNVIAATTNMEVEAFIQWASCFYDLMARGHSLAHAYDVARSTTDTPMVLLMKQDLTVDNG